MPARRKTVAKIIQDALVGRFVPDAAGKATITDYAGVPIVGRRKKTISSDIEAALSVLGVCIFVFPGLVRRVNKNVPGPYAESLQVRLRVIELPDFNKALPDAYELAEMLLVDFAECDLRQVDGLAGINPLQPLDEPIQDVPDEDYLMFDVLFETSVGLPASDDDQSSWLPNLAVKKDTLPLTSGDTEKVVAFESDFGATPQVYPIVIPPPGGDIIAVALSGQPDVSGFTVVFAAPIPAAGYTLSWIAFE
jgi:hypothetical protein